MLDTAQRIIRITTPTSSGSGHLIAPRLVLTSAHLVPEAGGQVQVHTATDHQPHTGHVLWCGTPHGHDDAALIEVTDPAWAEHVVTTRWGRLVTTTPRTPCEVWGYPDLVQRSGRAAETAQLVGTVAPGTHFVNHRHVMDLSAHPPRWYPHEVRQQERDGRRRSLWAGLSGAGMRCADGQLLVGVVTSDLEHRDHAALEIVPVYVLAHDPAFRAVVAEHGAPLDLEPVELAHLAHTRPAHRRPSPASLLEAHRRVVDFHGREEIMETLSQWCDEEEVLSAVVVHGPGGQGKTRLGHELTTRLTHPDAHGRRWATVWLTGAVGVDQLDRLEDTTAPLLLVVDYAETRTAQLIRLLQLFDRPPGSAPVRLLLLVRTVGEWWEQVNNATDYLLADICQQISLPPLAPRTIERAQEYRTALHQLARALPGARTPQAADWVRTADGLADPDLAGPEWETVLSVHMRALADLMDATQSARSVTTDSAVEGRVLAHEYRYWEQSAAAHGLDEAELAQPLREVLALAFTLTPATVEEADHLLENTAVLEGQTAARRDQIRLWISGLYPTDGTGIWGHLQPDRLLEYFLGQRLQRNPALFDPHVDTITETDAERLVTLYARAATHPALPSVGRHLTALCADHVDVLGSAVIEVATQVESPGPLIQALEEVTADPDTSFEVLEQLVYDLPQSSQRLAVWAERLTARMVVAHRQRAELDPEDYLSDLALFLNKQALRVGALGRSEEALDAITESVLHYRTLAEQRPDAHLPDLAMALNNQANDLGDLGRSEEALDAITESVLHYRTLGEKNSGSYLPELAASLDNQANHLGNLGRAEEAFESNTESVVIRRSLAYQYPDAYLSDLALSLSNQSIRLGNLGRPEEALEASAQAVYYYRYLSEQRPDAILPDLALSLNGYAIDLDQMGRTEEALEAITEAVVIRRSLVDLHIDSYLPDLAVSLHNQSMYLGTLGRLEEALEVIIEAVSIRGALAEQRPDAYVPDLALSLSSLSNCLSSLGRLEEALEATTQAVHHYRILASHRPKRYRSGLASSLNNQSNHLGDLGRVEEAFEAIAEAVNIRRALSEQRSGAYLHDLAVSLNNKSNQLSDLGRVEEALEAITQAVNIYRDLYVQRPDAFLPDIAMALNNHAICLAESGRVEEALEAIAEAVSIRGALAEKHPDSYVPDLADSLNNQFLYLAVLGRSEEALRAITQAVQYYRTLVDQRPDAHLPKLATFLNNKSLHFSDLGQTEEAVEAVTEAVEIRTSLAEKRPSVHQEELETSLRWLETLRNPEGGQG